MGNIQYVVGNGETLKTSPKITVKDERENIIEKSQYDGRTGYRVFGEQFITPLPINLITKHINQQIERYRLVVRDNYMILNKFA